MATPEADFEHAPVMPAEVVRYVAEAIAAGPIIDCTAGGAGHSRALLDAFPDATLLALDRDPDAVAIARRRLAPYGDRAQVVHARFSEVRAVLERLGAAEGPARAVLADLGVSSHQLDTPARGFSFRAAGPLDMRMDPTDGESAAEVLARIDEADLADALRTLGEERHARRVARRLVQERPTDTAELARLVRAVVPPARDRIDPATRTFQALRMLVNRELDELHALLDALPELLAPGGVAVLISFHSLEDRAVKHRLRELARGCVCPPRQPVCTCGRRPAFEVLTRRPVRASAAELLHNPRARSAKLRAARRLASEAS